MRYKTSIKKGRGEGKKIGAPTLNLEVPSGLAEDFGIYAGLVWLQGEKKKAVFHWGPIPVYGIAEPSLEAHILDEDLSLSPNEAEFELLSFLREIMHFQTKEDLSSQIQNDVSRAREILQQK